MRRRIFLKGSIAAISTLPALPISSQGAESRFKEGEAPSKSDFPGDGYEAPSWLRYSRAVNFEGYGPPVYPHMKDFDASRLVKSVLEVGADTLRFAGVAYWAYYPSKAFRVHPELGNRDLVEEVSRECRRQAVHLYAYTGYGHPHMEMGWVDQHPKYEDWVLRGPDGKPYGRYFHEFGARQRLCITGDAYRQGIRQVVRELCEHDIDGVYFDSPSAFGYTGVCFCESCRKNFRKFSGLDLDRLAGLAKLNGLPFDWGSLPADVDIKTLSAWYAWANQLTKEDLLDFRKIIHGSGKFMLCHNGQTWHGGTALFEQYRIPDGFLEEASIQTYQRLVTGLRGASMARPCKKLAQMYLGSYAVNWFGDPPHDIPWTTNDTNVEDGDEVRMEGCVDLACGNAPIYCTGNRLYYRLGSGSREPAQEIFDLMRQKEAILKDSVPVPYVAIVQPWESLQLWRSRRQSWNLMMSEALALVMLEERISFDVNPSTEMSEEWLEQQGVIALCGASGISDEQARKLGAWVKRGGGLLATYDTGLYDERGQLRQDGGALREVLGVEMKGEPLEPQPESYYRIQEDHPALGGYGAGAMLQGDLRLVPVEASGGGRILANCWNLGTNESRGPAIVVNSYGQGRTIYVSGSLEGFYTASRIESIRRLLGSMVEYLGGGALRPFKLSAPQGVYGMLRRAKKGDLMLWVLGNVGFKDAAVGRMRQEFVPVSNVEVGIRVPAGQQPKSIHFVRENRTAPFEMQGGYAVATIPSLHIAELVHLELA